MLSVICRFCDTCRRGLSRIQMNCLHIVCARNVLPQHHQSRSKRQANISHYANKKYFHYSFGLFIFYLSGNSTCQVFTAQLFPSQEMHNSEKRRKENENIGNINFPNYVDVINIRHQWVIKIFCNQDKKSYNAVESQSSKWKSAKIVPFSVSLGFGVIGTLRFVLFWLICRHSIKVFIWGYCSSDKLVYHLFSEKNHTISMNLNWIDIWRLE